MGSKMVANAKQNDSKRVAKYIFRAEWVRAGVKYVLYTTSDYSDSPEIASVHPISETSDEAKKPHRGESERAREYGFLYLG